MKALIESNPLRHSGCTAHCHLMGNRDSHCREKKVFHKILIVCLFRKLARQRMIAREDFEDRIEINAEAAENFRRLRPMIASDYSAALARAVASF